MGFRKKIFSFYFSFQPTDSDDIPIALKTTEENFCYSPAQSNGQLTLL